jgi:glycosyltransferase involved in cell wall biosynthesis
MNVLHISHSDIFGGAAIAGYRLHQGLLAQGVDSRLLVGAAKSRDERVTVMPKKPGIENRLFRLCGALGFNGLHSVGTFDVPKLDVYQNANVLNFHNLHSGAFNYLAVSSLTRYKPAVFTLHDMWGFTGHCAYSYDCERWKTGCGKCPYLDAYPAVKRDVTQLEWRLKQWTYQHSNLTIVAPSRWLVEQAKQSMLNRFPIHHIPYGIDLEAYQPLDPEQCRSLLGVPEGKRTILFGAQSLNDSRKGGDILLKALQGLPNSLKTEIVLLTLGNGGETIEQTVGIQTIDLGYISSDRLKSVAYSAADLVVFPTRADNLPLILQESLACGTPMVSCKVGGVADLVRPGVTGYLAEPDNPIDLRDGILQLLEDVNGLTQMRQQCREIAVQEYSLELQAKRYMELYQQLSLKKT